MGRKYTERREYPVEVTRLARSIEVALFECGLPPLPPATSSSAPLEIRASQPSTAFSWGENILAQIAKSPGGGSQVVIESKLKFGFFDWGRNKANVDLILEALDRRVEL